MVDMPKRPPLDLDVLGARVRQARAERRLSLSALAARAGVSRSMLSAVEAGRKTPTVLVLDRIATGLDTSIARLLGEERAGRVVLLRHADQDVARDRSGWERRILSPVLPGVEFEFMRTTIGAGIDAGVFSPHTPGSREYVAVERGTLRLTIDGTAHLLRAGDSIYYAGDCLHGFANPGATACVYYLAMDVAGDRRHVRYRRAACRDAASSTRRPRSRVPTRGSRSRAPARGLRSRGPSRAGRKPAPSRSER
jgi:transcriptional regulator with XRE-family HTH domain